MSYSTSSGNALNTALAALAGVVAATVVKLLLDEATEAPASVASPAIRHSAIKRAKLQELAEASRDPQYLADMQEVNDDFAHIDAEML
jgi:hypothetical protein